MIQYIVLSSRNYFQNLPYNKVYREFIFIILSFYSIKGHVYTSSSNQRKNTNYTKTVRATVFLSKYADSTTQSP